MENVLEEGSSGLERRGVREGLTGAEARLLLAEVGPNEPAPARRRSGLKSLLLLFVNTLVAFLLLLLPATCSYLLFVELVKRRLMRHLTF